MTSFALRSLPSHCVSGGRVSLRQTSRKSSLSHFNCSSHPWRPVCQLLGRHPTPRLQGRGKMMHASGRSAAQKTDTYARNRNPKPAPNATATSPKPATACTTANGRGTRGRGWARCGCAMEARVRHYKSHVTRHTSRVTRHTSHVVSRIGRELACACISPLLSRDRCARAGRKIYTQNALALNPLMKAFTFSLHLLAAPLPALQPALSSLLSAKRAGRRLLTAAPVCDGCSCR